MLFSYVCKIYGYLFKIDKILRNVKVKTSSCLFLDLYLVTYSIYFVHVRVLRAREIIKKNCKMLNENLCLVCYFCIYF